MRKTTALLSASTLGVVAAAAGVAAPASADIITEPRCETFAEHTDMPAFDPEADWYMTCVPQYGLGKAEFTLNAPDSGFPEDFDVVEVDRTDSPDASGLAEYFGPLTGPEDPEDPEANSVSWVTPALIDEDASTDSSLRVGATVIAPVTSVGRLDETPAAVATACELDGETPVVTFVSTYGAVTTTFSFVGTDGLTYSSPITLTPDPTYYVFSDPDEVGPGSICISDSQQTYLGDAESMDSAALFGLFMVPPFVWFADLEETADPFSNLPNLGNFTFAAPAAPAEPVPAPQLADSGAEHVVPLGLAAGVLGGLGALLFAFSRRRRTEG